MKTEKCPRCGRRSERGIGATNDPSGYGWTENSPNPVRRYLQCLKCNYRVVAPQGEDVHNYFLTFPVPDRAKDADLKDCFIIVGDVKREDLPNSVELQKRRKGFMAEMLGIEQAKPETNAELTGLRAEVKRLTAALATEIRAVERLAELAAEWGAASDAEAAAAWARQPATQTKED